MSFFLDNQSPSATPPEILLPPSAKVRKVQTEKEVPVPNDGGNDAHADTEELPEEKPKAAGAARPYDMPFTLQELKEAADYYLSQGMPQDTPVYITTADKRLPPRSKTAMIGLYPGIMEEAGQLRIEPRRPLIKQKQGLLSKILKNM